MTLAHQIHPYTHLTTHHMVQRFIPVFTTVLLSCLPTYADHGREFLSVHDAHVGKRGQGSLGLNGDWKKYGTGPDEYGLEGSIYYSLGKKLALATGVSFDNTRDEFSYSGISPHILVPLTPDSSRIRLSLLAGYQFAEKEPTVAAAEHAHHSVLQPKYILKTETVVHKASNSSQGHSHSHAGKTGHSEVQTSTRQIKVRVPQSLSAGKSAATPSHAEHSHQGVHQHNTSGWTARLIGEVDLAPTTKVAANLVYFNAENAKPALGYAVGVRQTVTETLSVGVEAIGDMGSTNEDSHEVILGTYLTPHHDLTLKLGVGLGLTDAAPELSVRTGVVWRF